MERVPLILASAATGALLAVFILVVFVFAEGSEYVGSFAGLFVGFFGLAALSASIVNQVSKRTEWPEVSLKMLIPIGCITSIMPLFGPLFGLPNTNPVTLATVVAMGAVGGAFWSLPFVVWDRFNKR